MQARVEPSGKLKLREGLRELAQRVLVADARDLLPLLAALVLLFVRIFGRPRQTALERGARRGGLGSLLRAKHFAWPLIGRDARRAGRIPPLLAFPTAMSSKAREEWLAGRVTWMWTADTVYRLQGRRA